MFVCLNRASVVLIIPQKEKTELIPSLSNHIINGMSFLLNDQSQLATGQKVRFQMLFSFSLFLLRGQMRQM